MKNQKPTFFHIESIAQVHDFYGLGKPLHPLITVFRSWPSVEFDFTNVKFSANLYLISLKGNRSGSFGYGRNSYDFEEGTLTFIAPNQVTQFSNASKTEKQEGGWTLIFHPDLLLRSTLQQNIKKYSFFNYDTNEALHISDKEKQKLNVLLEYIETELNQNIDKHSQTIILANIESLLKYCLRYYERQFHTRTNLYKEIVTRLEQFINMQIEAGEGIPTVSDCGKEMNMSANYLSDLLRIETGKSAKYHIHSLLVEKAKTTLLNSNQSIGEIAYYLGFEYPQHFSKLFKNKTGLSPSEFRNLN